MTSQVTCIDEIVVREAVPSSETVRERFGALDGLRALAILAMLAYEIVRLTPALVARNAFAATAAFDASQGFTLLLVISGFALAYPAIVACTENGGAYLDVGRFAVKRLLRIYPAYGLALVLAIVVPPLAMRYGLPALAGGTQAIAPDAWRNVFFAGDGLGNDGFRALGIIARCYIAFPFLLLLWARAPKFFPLAIVLASVLDAATALHGLGIGALVPFALGIVAADVRAQSLPAFRFGLPLALIAGVAALRFGPGLAALADAHAPGALRVDPLWSIALFGIVVAIGALHPLERMLSVSPLRFLGAASFAISLVAVPVSAFAIRQLQLQFGPATAAANALVASLVIGVALYQLIDRSFADGPLRREVAGRFGPPLDALLVRVRAHRVLLGKMPVAVEAELASASASAQQAAFYAPPPRPDAADLAIVSTRTGSAEDLAADILATKQRLSERSVALFAEPVALAAPVEYERPGFYRKAKALETSAPARDQQPIKMRINSVRDGAQPANHG
ncbi:MAG: hypothetical protein NVSMB19_11120 [Vulcanimicrobiaceae bacterium]